MTMLQLVLLNKLSHHQIEMAMTDQMLITMSDNDFLRIHYIDFSNVVEIKFILNILTKQTVQKSNLLSNGQ